MYRREKRFDSLIDDIDTIFIQSKLADKNLVYENSNALVIRGGENSKSFRSSPSFEPSKFRTNWNDPDRISRISFDSKERVAFPLRIMENKEDESRYTRISELEECRSRFARAKVMDAF